MKKFFLVFIIVMTAFIGLVYYNNRFGMNIKNDLISLDGGKIAVEYAQPKGNTEKPGLLMFIHGDGPTNKNSDEGYYPAWETLAKENYISISWDKAGVGNSTGNWLEQDMIDRKKEAEKVLTWALDHFDVNPDKVGVWGASQGGWVITKLLNENNKIKFAIGVAPAVNWMKQGKFNTISAMTDEGYSQNQIDKKLAVESQVNELLKSNDYQGYVDSQLEKKPMSKDRWMFIYKNMNLDNTNEIKEIRKPYYLIIGDHDINVDTKETENIYRKYIPEKYLMVYSVKNATHRMLKPRHQRDNSMMVVEAIINPRELFAPDYFKALKDIVSKIK